MFISSAEKQYINDTLHDLNKRVEAQAAIHQQSMATLNEQNKRLSDRLNLLVSGNNASTSVSSTDKEFEIMKHKNVMLKEQVKSLTHKYDSLVERYEAETQKQIITRNRISNRQAQAIQAINELKGTPAQVEQ